MVKDNYGREITHLRISVTKECNLNCLYCHKEGDGRENKRKICPEEIKRIVHVACKLGIRKIKITGGEPLLRKDIFEILKGISEEGVEDLSMTTNGFFIDEKTAIKLKESGLKRINIGCDGLSNILPKNIKNVENAIKNAKYAGLNPVKINMVVLKGINEKEINKMMEISKKYNAILQLIELIPLNNPFFDKFYFSLENIEKEFEKKASKIVIRDINFRKQYFIDGTVVEIIRSHLNRKFCENCKKLRITNDGYVKPCLMRNDNLVKINFENDEEILNSLLEGIKRREIYYK